MQGAFGAAAQEGERPGTTQGRPRASNRRHSGAEHSPPPHRGTCKHRIFEKTAILAVLHTFRSTRTRGTSPTPRGRSPLDLNTIPHRETTPPPAPHGAPSAQSPVTRPRGAAMRPRGPFFCICILTAYICIRAPPQVPRAPPGPGAVRDHQGCPQGGRPRHSHPTPTCLHTGNSHLPVHTTRAPGGVNSTNPATPEHMGRDWHAPARSVAHVKSNGQSRLRCGRALTWRVWLT